MSHVVLGSDEGLSLTLASGLGTDVLGLDAPLPRGTTGVVIVVGSKPEFEPSATSTLDGAEWTRLADDPMRQALRAFQRARAACGRGGRIVLVAPTVGIPGAAGLVPYCTAVEGIRSMAKSAARQWAADGISVNTITAPLHLFAPALAPSARHLTAAAVQDAEGLVASIVETVKLLLRNDIQHLVGATIVVDGGAVMLP